MSVPSKQFKFLIIQRVLVLVAGAPQHTETPPKPRVPHHTQSSVASPHRRRRRLRRISNVQAQAPVRDVEHDEELYYRVVEHDGADVASGRPDAALKLICICDVRHT